MKSPILGGAGEYRSQNLAYNRCVNLYPELVTTKDGREPGALMGCPGLTLLATVGTGPIRGLWAAVDGNLYAVSGNQWYLLTPSYAATLLGTIGTNAGPVSMIDNGGKQVQLVDGKNVYVWNYSTNTFSTIAISSTGPIISCYQDGWGLINQLGTNQFWSSNLNDFTQYTGLMFSSADSTPDQIVTMADIHREVWLFKQRVTEVWVNGGLSGFAFQRLQGVQIMTGCMAPYSVARAGESLIWLAQDAAGVCSVMMSKGYQGVPISTPGVDFSIAQMAASDGITDAIGFTYFQAGHFFYVLTFPSGNRTWTYDLTTNLWHERAAFSNGSFERHAANCCAYFAKTPVVGDASNGNIYAYDLNNYTDNNAARKWLRTWRALPPNNESYQPLRFDSLQVGMQTGINIPSGYNPQYMLRWSNDGCHTWSNEFWSDSNETGLTGARVMFRRLGSTRRGQGSDRVFELSNTDPVPVALIGADLAVSAA